MSRMLSTKGMERLNEISNKYRFQDEYELEQEEIVQFCEDFQDAERLGLRVDKEDSDFVEQVLYVYTYGE